MSDEEDHYLSCAEDAYSEDLQLQKKAFQRNAELFRIPSRQLVPPGKTLLPFQEEDCYRLLTEFADRKGIYNGNPMGAGKTIETAACLNWHYDHAERAPRVLILCSAAGCGVWQGELPEWLIWPADIQRLENSKQRVNVLAENPIVIVSYDLAIRKEIALDLLSHSWDIMICDESHHLGSFSSKRSRLVLGSLYPKIGFKVYFLSGSISRNKLDQVWPVCRTIAPDVIPPYWHFAYKFCNVIETHFGKRVTGAKDKATAKAFGKLALSKFLVRRPKKQVLSFLPERLEQKVILHHVPEMDDYKNKKAGDDFAPEIIEKAMATEVIPPALATAYRELGLLKVNAAVEYIKEMLEELGPDEPIFVLCYHKSVLASLAAHLITKEIGSGAMISGDSTAKQKSEAIRLFQSGELRLLLATYALSESVTLTRTAYLVRVERAWSRLQNEQALDRIHRIGQNRQCYVKDLVVPNTLDSIVYSRLKLKLKEHERTFG